VKKRRKKKGMKRPSKDRRALPDTIFLREREKERKGGWKKGSATEQREKKKRENAILRAILAPGGRGGEPSNGREGEGFVFPHALIPSNSTEPEKKKTGGPMKGGGGKIEAIKLILTSPAGKERENRNTLPNLHQLPHCEKKKRGVRGEERGKKKRKLSFHHPAVTWKEKKTVISAWRERGRRESSSSFPVLPKKKGRVERVAEGRGEGKPVTLISSLIRGKQRT